VDRHQRFGQPECRLTVDISRRTRNDAECVRGRRLLLQRLSEVGRALVQFVEQSRVLDGDDRLRCEVLDEFDLLISESANFLSR
jgi:hypothetical protein